MWCIMGKVETLWNRAVTTIYTGRNNLKITKKKKIFIHLNQPIAHELQFTRKIQNEKWRVSLAGCLAAKLARTQFDLTALLSLFHWKVECEWLCVAEISSHWMATCFSIDSTK